MIPLIGTTVNILIMRVTSSEEDNFILFTIYDRLERAVICVEKQKKVASH